MSAYMSEATSSFTPPTLTKALFLRASTRRITPNITPALDELPTVIGKIRTKTPTTTLTTIPETTRVAPAYLYFSLPVSLDGPSVRNGAAGSPSRLNKFPAGDLEPDQFSGWSRVLPHNGRHGGSNQSLPGMGEVQRHLARLRSIRASEIGAGIFDLFPIGLRQSHQRQPMSQIKLIVGMRILDVANIICHDKAALRIVMRRQALHFANIGVGIVIQRIGITRLPAFQLHNIERKRSLTPDAAPALDQSRQEIAVLRGAAGIGSSLMP